MNIPKWQLAFLFFTPTCQATPVQLVTFDYPPYTTQGDQRENGLASNIVREVFSRLRQDIHIKFYPFNRGLALVTYRQVDGFFPLKKTSDRELTLVYPSKPLLTQEYVFFVRKDSNWKFSGTLESISSARMGITRNTSYGPRFDKALKSGIFKNIDTTDTHEMNLRKLLAGRVDVVPCSRLVGLHLLQSITNGDKAEVSGPSIESVPSYLVFSAGPNAARLVKIFDKTMDDMDKDGTLARLLNK